MTGSQGLVRHTPWRSQADLLRVRRWLYPAKDAGRSALLVHEQTEAEWQAQQQACDWISAWSTRAPLPHLVESTWLLTVASVADARHTPSHDTAAHGISLKAQYVLALTRFVTAVLDEAQTSRFKVSMYTKAQEIGLPAFLVDLRHEATHGELPSLVMLRKGAVEALQWLWDRYWGGLDSSESVETDTVSLAADDTVESWTEWTEPVFGIGL